MHVGVVLAERLEAFPFLKIMDPLFLPAQPMVNKKKIKFVCGCGASREVGSIIISKNKAPLHLLLHSVKWSLFIHLHCFLLSQPKFACGCGANKKAGSNSICKNKDPPL